MLRVRAMRNFFSPVVTFEEVTEQFTSQPNPGLSGQRAVGIFTGSTLGGSSAINGGQFSVPPYQVLSQLSYAPHCGIRFKSNVDLVDRGVCMHELHACMQVVEGWGIEGLDAATAERLYGKVREQLAVAQPPPELTTSYNEEYFAANEAAGVDVVAPPDVPFVRLPKLHQ